MNLVFYKTALFPAMFLAFVMSCDRKAVTDPNLGSDPSVRLAEPWQSRPGVVVENGNVFDRGEINISQYKKIVLPENAHVERKAEDAKLQIYLRKTLGFVGHPPASMRVREWREKLGCATKAEKDKTLDVATFGEWDSHIEGGALIELVVVVPREIEIEKRVNFSGEHSAAQNTNDLGWLRESGIGYWYAASLPAKEWTVIPTMPDPQRRADIKN